MNARQQGIYDHNTVELIEKTYKRLRRLGVEGPEADRIAKAFVTRASGFTAEQAIEAATRPAGEPESPAMHETTPDPRKDTTCHALTTSTPTSS